MSGPPNQTILAITPQGQQTDTAVPVSYRRNEPCALGLRSPSSPVTVHPSPLDDDESPVVLPRRLSLASTRSREPSVMSPPSLISHESGHCSERSLSVADLRRFPTRTSTDSCLPTPHSYASPLSPTDESFSNHSHNQSFSSISHTHPLNVPVRRRSSIRYGSRSRTSSFDVAPINPNRNSNSVAPAFNPGSVGVGFDRPELRAEFLGRHQREFPDRHVPDNVTEEVFMEQQRTLQDTKIDARSNFCWAQIHRLRHGLADEERPPSRRLRTLSLVPSRSSSSLARSVSSRKGPATAPVLSTAAKRVSVASVPSVASETAIMGNISLDTSTRRVKSLVETGSPVTPPRRTVAIKAEVQPATPVESSPDSVDSKAQVVQTPESVDSSFAETDATPSGRWSGDPSMLSLTSMDRYFPEVVEEKEDKDAIARAHAMDRLNGKSTVDKLEVEIGWLETVERLERMQKDHRRMGYHTEIDFANCATQLFPPSETASEAPSSPVRSPIRSPIRSPMVTSPRSPTIARVRTSKLRYSLGSAFSPTSSLYHSERSASRTNNSDVPTTAGTSTTSVGTIPSRISRPTRPGITIPTPATTSSSQWPEDKAFVATSAWHSGACEGALQSGFHYGEEESLGDRGPPRAKTATKGSSRSFVAAKAKATPKRKAVNPKMGFALVPINLQRKKRKPAPMANARLSPPSSRRTPSTRSGPTRARRPPVGFSKFLATCSAHLRRDNHDDDEPVVVSAPVIHRSQSPEERPSQNCSYSHSHSSFSPSRDNSLTHRSADHGVHIPANVNDSFTKPPVAPFASKRIPTPRRPFPITIPARSTFGNSSVLSPTSPLIPLSPASPLAAEHPHPETNKHNALNENNATEVLATPPRPPKSPRRLRHVKNVVSLADAFVADCVPEIPSMLSPAEPEPQSELQVESEEEPHEESEPEPALSAESPVDCSRPMSAVSVASSLLDILPSPMSAFIEITPPPSPKPSVPIAAAHLPAVPIVANIDEAFATAAMPPPVNREGKRKAFGALAARIKTLSRPNLREEVKASIGKAADDSISEMQEVSVVPTLPISAPIAAETSIGTTAATEPDDVKPKGDIEPTAEVEPKAGWAKRAFRITRSIANLQEAKAEPKNMPKAYDSIDGDSFIDSADEAPRRWTKRLKKTRSKAKFQPELQIEHLKDMSISTLDIDERDAWRQRTFLPDVKTVPHVPALPNLHFVDTPEVFNVPIIHHDRVAEELAARHPPRLANVANAVKMKVSFGRLAPRKQDSHSKLPKLPKHTRSEPKLAQAAGFRQKWHYRPSRHDEQ